MYIQVKPVSSWAELIYFLNFTYVFFSGSGDTLSISDEQTIDEYVKYYHIKVSAILVPNDERLPMAFYDAVAQLSGGSSHVIREARHRTVKTYVELLDAFRNLLWDHRGPVSQVIKSIAVRLDWS